MRNYVALLTPHGEGGISVIHLMGNNALALIQKVFQLHKPVVKPNLIVNKLYLGYILNQKNKERLDEVIIHYIPSNQTMTGLVTIEINAHGGIIASQRIIKCLQAQGARLINQKQVIELAYKNRRLDRIQQEALECLIQAPTQLASLIYLTQYQGQLSEKISELINQIEPFVPSVSSVVKSLLSTAPLGLAISYPKRIVIAGRTNAGKSTLFNALFGKERVITHHAPGTTRDAVEETIALEGVPFKLIDTAGLRCTTKGIEGSWSKATYLPTIVGSIPLPVNGIPINREKRDCHTIERIAQSISRKELKQADIIILLLDGSVSLNKQDITLLKELKDIPCVVVINKSDLPQRIDINTLSKRIKLIQLNPLNQFNPLTDSTSQIIAISALQGTGIDQLKKKILAIVLPSYSTFSLSSPFANQPIIFTHRQYKRLKETHAVLSTVTDSEQNTLPKSKIGKIKQILERILQS
jgi:tRNA modification GTPase